MALQPVSEGIKNYMIVMILAACLLLLAACYVRARLTAETNAHTHLPLTAYLINLHGSRLLGVMHWPTSNWPMHHTNRLRKAVGQCITPTDARKQLANASHQPSPESSWPMHHTNRRQKAVGQCTTTTDSRKQLANALHQPTPEGSWPVHHSNRL